MAAATQSLQRQFSKFIATIVKKDLLLSILVAFIVIIFGVFLGWENNKVVPLNTNPIVHYRAEGQTGLNFMSNWDGPDYLQIVATGYTSASQTNFFPLYPIVVRAINWVLHSRLYSALLVSWVAFIGAIYFYLKIIKQLSNGQDNREALRGVLLFVLFPTGVFLLATYTESLFAMLALGAIFYALQKRYLPAALLTMLATATHVNGLFLLVLIPMLLFEQREKLSKILVSLLIGAGGILSYMAYLAIRFKNPFAFITAQRAHGWLRNGYANHLLTTLNIFNLAAIILLILSILYWRNRRKSFALYSFFYLCIPFIGGQFGGFNRYVLMAFPVQIMLYERFKKSSIAYTAVIAIFVALWSYFMLQYAGGYVGG